MMIFSVSAQEAGAPTPATTTTPTTPTTPAGTETNLEEVTELLLGVKADCALKFADKGGVESEECQNLQEDLLFLKTDFVIGDLKTKEQVDEAIKKIKIKHKLIEGEPEPECTEKNIAKCECSSVFKNPELCEGDNEQCTDKCRDMLERNCEAVCVEGKCRVNCERESELKSWVSQPSVIIGIIVAIVLIFIVLKLKRSHGENLWKKLFSGKETAKKTEDHLKKLAHTELAYLDEIRKLLNDKTRAENILIDKLDQFDDVLKVWGRQDLSDIATIKHGLMESAGKATPSAATDETQRKLVGEDIPHVFDHIAHQGKLLEDLEKKIIHLSKLAAEDVKTIYDTLTEEESAILKLLEFGNLKKLKKASPESLGLSGDDMLDKGEEIKARVVRIVEQIQERQGRKFKHILSEADVRARVIAIMRENELFNNVKEAARMKRKIILELHEEFNQLIDWAIERTAVPPRGFIAAIEESLKKFKDLRHTGNVDQLQRHKGTEDAYIAKLNDLIDNEKQELNDLLKKTGLSTREINDIALIRAKLERLKKKGGEKRATPSRRGSSQEPINIINVDESESELVVHLSAFPDDLKIQLVRLTRKSGIPFYISFFSEIRDVIYTIRQERFDINSNGIDIITVDEKESHDNKKYIAFDFQHDPQVISEKDLKDPDIIEDKAGRKVIFRFKGPKLKPLVIESIRTISSSIEIGFNRRADDAKFQFTDDKRYLKGDQVFGYFIFSDLVDLEYHGRTEIEINNWGIDKIVVEPREISGKRAFAFNFVPLPLMDIKKPVAGFHQGREKFLISF
ncbi:hypothetical protein ACFL0W_03840 [Nanoarchaeota archaeon]